MSKRDIAKALKTIIESCGEECDVSEVRKVIVRSRDAGVLYGTYVSNDGSTIRLENARQMWLWFAAKGHTLIDVARHGVKADKCKFSPADATVTVFNACAMIEVTDPDAIKSIESA